MAHPFHPDDTSFNRANAIYLAHASDIAYIRSPAAAARERLGLRTFAFLNKVNRTRGFLGVCETHAVLAFRGSDPVTLQTWVTDAVIKLVECGEYGGRVHRGFSSALRRTWKKIELVLEQAGDKPLFLTGHSMGGALAVLTACRLTNMGRPPVAVYTYGAPRVGDLNFCKGYALPTYRVVNRRDIVPEMPFASVKRLLPEKARFTSEKILGRVKRMARAIPCYGHVKTFVYIDLDGRITTDAKIEARHAKAAARAVATRGRSVLDGLGDHLISSYIRGLEGKAVKKRTATRRLQEPPGV